MTKRYRSALKLDLTLTTLMFFINWHYHKSLSVTSHLWNCWITIWKIFNDSKRIWVIFLFNISNLNNSETFCSFSLTFNHKIDIITRVCQSPLHYGTVDMHFWINELFWCVPIWRDSMEADQNGKLDNIEQNASHIFLLGFRIWNRRSIFSFKTV